MKREAGNALFLILIAVALFAALSYAITQSSRGGGGIEKEQEMLDTAVAQQCEASVDHGIMRLDIVNGCSEDEISYELADGTNENPNNPSDTSCFIFHSDGAGVAPCGDYLDPILPLGTISANDTSTYAVLPGIGYMYCSAWLPGEECVPEISFDGVNFAPRAICSSSAGVETSALRNLFCQSACGGNNAGGGGNTVTGDTVLRYFSDGSTSSDISGCGYTVVSVSCFCF